MYAFGALMFGHLAIGFVYFFILFTRGEPTSLGESQPPGPPAVAVPCVLESAAELVALGPPWRVLPAKQRALIMNFLRLTGY